MNVTAADPPSRYNDMPPYVWVPILLGIFLIIAASIGFAGAKYYSRLLLLVYVIFVALLLVTQFVLAMLLFVSPSTLAWGLGLAEQQVEGWRCACAPSMRAYTRCPASTACPEEWLHVKSRAHPSSTIICLSPQSSTLAGLFSESQYVVLL